MHKRRRPTVAQRALVTTRAKGCCEYCWSQESFSADVFSVEHIIPVARGGTTSAENLALACQGCNNHKYTAIDAIDPLTGSIATLYNPREHKWKMHFRWSDSFVELIGLSPIGRATVAKLMLNRRGVVNLRFVLHSVGKHPPS